jgi:hypothetical protein
MTGDHTLISHSFNLRSRSSCEYVILNNSVRIKKTQFAFTNIICLMLFTVSRENHVTPVSTKGSIMTVNEGGAYSYHSAALKG